MYTKTKYHKFHIALQRIVLALAVFTVPLFISAETLLADPPNVAAAVCDTELKFGDIAIDDDAILNGSVDRFVFDMLRIGGGGGLLHRPCVRFSGGAVRGACCSFAYEREGNLSFSYVATN